MLRISTLSPADLDALAGRNPAMLQCMMDPTRAATLQGDGSYSVAAVTPSPLSTVRRRDESDAEWERKVASRVLDPTIATRMRLPPSPSLAAGGGGVSADEEAGPAAFVPPATGAIGSVAQQPLPEPELARQRRGMARSLQTGSLPLRWPPP